ncbi:class I SAM-dependent methyltransferase [Natrinema sp. 74]|uniref:class I SAM-dependent methyltransferase n=1 Tax=Natrinema sp. 74 TaxID=3384159 RepID=UPI0038D38E19
MAGNGGWQLTESGPEAYEQYLVPPLFGPWAERLIKHANIREGDRVLDVGCGTGIMARRAATHVGEQGTVVGIDINEAMLTVARTATADITPAIEWRQGDATALPFSDETFDVIFCQQALQFVEDPAVALREMHRVLAPEGRLAVSVFRPLSYNVGYDKLAEALERHAGAEAGMMMRSPFRGHSRKELRALAEDAGFSDPVITIEISSVRYPSVEEFVRREAASSPLAGSLDSLDRGVREVLLDDIAEALHDYIDDQGIVIPLDSHVLVAQR